MTRDLNTIQLVWCRQNIRSFAPAERQVHLRDETAAESNAKAKGCWPPEAKDWVIDPSPAVTAPRLIMRFGKFPS